MCNLNLNIEANPHANEAQRRIGQGSLRIYFFLLILRTRPEDFSEEVHLRCRLILAIWFKYEFEA